MNWIDPVPLAWLLTASAAVELSLMLHPLPPQTEEIEFFIFFICVLVEDKASRELAVLVEEKFSLPCENSTLPDLVLSFGL